MEIWAGGGRIGIGSREPLTDKRMSALELKAEIHRKIDALENVAELVDVNQSLDWYLQGNLTAEEHAVLSRLETARHHAAEGTGLPHETVMNEARTWVKR